MIALVGSEGSMGKRYQAIFNYLNVPYVALDRLKQTADEIDKEVEEADRILIATPTPTHTELLRKYLPLKKPILCEKPVSKNIDELIELHAWCARSGYSYQMVMQYKELLDEEALNANDLPSYYNYFRTGKDGLIWDCMQIIALARSAVAVIDASPIWTCMINGKLLRFSDMDAAYLLVITQWLANSLTQTMDDILHIHQKVVDYYESN